MVPSFPRRKRSDYYLYYNKTKEKATAGLFVSASRPVSTNTPYPNQTQRLDSCSGLYKCKSIEIYCQIHEPKVGIEPTTLALRKRCSTN